MGGRLGSRRSDHFLAGCFRIFSGPAHLYLVTWSLGLRAGSLPPGFREVSRQRGDRWLFYPIPSRDPLFAGAKYGDSVEAGHQDTIERPDRRDEGGAITRREHGRNHGIHGGIPGPHIVARPGDFGGLAAEVKGLFISRRQRLIPAVLDHVEVVAEPTLVELYGIDGPHRCRDACALQLLRVGKRDALLVAGGGEDLERQRRAGRALTQHRAVKDVTRLGEQFEGTAQRGAVTARAVRDRKTVAAVENVRRKARGKRLEESELLFIGGTCVGRQFR